MILHTVPIFVNEEDLEGVESDELTAISGSADAFALVLSTEKKEDPENQENANSVYDELFSNNEEDLKAKLVLDDNQKYFCPDSELSSKLMKKMESHSLLISKSENSEAVLDNLNGIENIKIIRSKETSINEDITTKLLDEDIKEEGVREKLIQTLKEETCLIILLTGGELDKEASPDLLLLKERPSLDILSSIFAL